MSGINKVILIGNLGATPELRTTANGDAIATISIATSESWIDKITGERKEITEWHRCIFFKKQAETIGKYLHKGSKVYVEGKLRTRQWQDKEGKPQYTTEIHCSSFQFLDGKSQTPYSELKEVKREENSIAEYSQNIDEEFPF